jgi:hypothetical protein
VPESLGFLLRVTGICSLLKVPESLDFCLCAIGICVRLVSAVPAGAATFPAEGESEEQ